MDIILLEYIMQKGKNMKEEKQTTKYRVTVCRTEYSFADIDVEANDPFEAECKAVDIAGDYDFSAKDMEFEAGTCIEL
jgi:hypothetical protein